MSGINELKEKSKKQLEMNEKRKMGLGEMFENQTVGKPGIQKDSNPEIKQAAQLDVQQSINPISHTAAHPEVQLSTPPDLQQAAISESQKDGHTAIHPAERMEAPKQPLQPARQPTILSKPSKSQRIPTCKMTFNLREDIHKAFNDLYANRILQGRATEKSEMICEAIQLLINMEEEQNNNR